MERLTAKQAQSMMEAVAAVYEKKEDCVDKDKKTKHNCAKKVCHKEHGEGACIPGKHTLLEDGTVTHYSVVFEHGVEEMIPVEDLEVLVTEMHEHAEMEGEDLQEVDLKKLYDGVVKNQPRGGSATPTPSATKPMQPASSAPPSVKNVESGTPPKRSDKPNTPDKPLATLNRAKRGDGFLGPTVSAGGYRMGIPNPVRKEEVEQVSEAGGPALPGEPGRPGTPKAPGGRPHLPGEKQTPKPKGNPGLRLAGVDLFDIVKGHLIDEGLTEEEALKKMLTLTDEERSEIIEGSCGSKKDKKKKGGYGK